MATLKELQKLLDKAAEEIPEQTMKIVEVVGLNFIKKNFEDEGFNDNGLTKWAERKTTDREGRDLTRHKRTTKRGSAGSLTKFGRENIGRAILTGHNTGGDKLRNSFKARREKLKVFFYTYKDYAQYHNEGKGSLPKRQFIGKSADLERKIENKFKKTLDKLLKP